MQIQRYQQYLAKSMDCLTQRGATGFTVSQHTLRCCRNLIANDKYFRSTANNFAPRFSVYTNCMSTLSQANIGPATSHLAHYLKK